ncbi:CBS domain-containing protein [Streptomyces sp. NPDC006430]|uniref:CBS domain-containing protein n=1 Tax=Streptomyces sp. NPDC006430 TaxID=3154299 RepID=UPI0033B2E12A
MTLIETHPYEAGCAPTVGDVMQPCGPQVCEDMSVEVALSVMAGALVGHLVLCDEDGRCTGLVTQTQLVAFRTSAAYTDRVRLGAVVRDRVPCIAEGMSVHDAERVLWDGPFGILPVVDADGCAAGVLTGAC